MEIQFQTMYYIYIVTNNLKDLWDVGVTADLTAQLQKLEGRKRPDECKHLVYVEEYAQALDTVKRESKLSGYSQRKLKKLVETKNPEMRFLNEECTIPREILL